MFWLLVSTLTCVAAAGLIFKLPFEFGAKWYVSQAYKDYTHINLDSYALDFTQNGCEAFGKLVVASVDGDVVYKQKNDPNSIKGMAGYGNAVIIKNDKYKIIYAHLRDETNLNLNQHIEIGEKIGYVGNTGRVSTSSNACPKYPGTHLHFRVTQIQPDGSEIAYKPEPISGYTNLLAGNWYTSDNALAKNEQTPKPDKNKNWLTRLWEKIKLVFVDTADLVNNGDVKVNAVVSDAKVEPIIQKQNEPKLDNIVQNNIVAVAPIKKADQLGDIQPKVVDNKIQDQIIPAQVNNNIVVPPPPGFGGGAAPIPVPVVQQVVANNIVDKNVNPDILPIQTPPPTIINPINNSIFATSTIIFSGTSTPDSIVFADGFDEVAMVNNLGEWSFSLQLPEGTSTVQFHNIILGQATSTPISVEVFVDTIAPVISFAIVECQFSLQDDNCLLPIASSTSAISTNELSSIKFYKDNVLINEEQGSVFNFEVPLLVGQNNFYATAVDSLGNQSTSTVQIVEYVEKPIIINEIAWSGTDISPFNEWMEIYNRTDKNLNMSRFQISSKDGVPKVLLEGNLSPNSYYLIERTDDNSVPEVVASLTAAFSGDGAGSGLSDQGEELVLDYKLGNVLVGIDRTPSVDVCGGWCFDSPMGRIDQDSDGSIMSSWDYDPNIYEPIFHKKGIQIAGTPKAQNFIHAVAQL